MIVGVTMVRDEADIIGWTLSHLLNQVDHVVVADNLSIDRTPDILASFDRVTVIPDLDPAYTQSIKMTRLAHLAGDMGADWVVPFDADEAWWLPDLDIDATVVTCNPHVYVPQPTDGEDPNPIARFRWRLPDPEPQHKVIFRYHPNASIHMGQHDVDRSGPRATGTSVRHYQYRSLEQVRRKVTNGVGAYNASSLSKIYGSHWRDLDALDDDGLRRWWDAYCCQDLVFDP